MRGRTLRSAIFNGLAIFLWQIYMEGEWGPARTLPPAVPRHCAAIAIAAGRAIITLVDEAPGGLCTGYTLLCWLLRGGSGHDRERRIGRFRFAVVITTERGTAKYSPPLLSAKIDGFAVLLLAIQDRGAETPVIVRTVNNVRSIGVGFESKQS